MVHIEVDDVQAWLETTKLEVTSLQPDLEAQIAAEVLARISVAYPDEIDDWTNHTNTPRLIKKIIAMMYSGWFYDRQYSETSDENSYADRLRAAAEALIAGIIAGSIDIIEIPGFPDVHGPLFFPTDQSSANEPTDDNPSDGPNVFSMGQIF
jgi:hypothetical protein